MSLLSRLMGFIFGVLLLIGIIVTGLLSTTSGSRWLLEQALVASNQNIVVSNIEGSLIGTLHVGRVEYQLKNGGLIHIDKLSLDWKLLALLNRQLSFGLLAAEALLIDMPPSGKRFSMPEFALPMELLVERLEVDELKIEHPESPITLFKLQAAGQFRGSELALQKVAIQLSDVHLAGDASMAFAKPFPFELAIALNQSEMDAHMQVEAGGVIDDYRFSGTAGYGSEGRTALMPEFSGIGTLSGIEFEALRSKGASGDISALGTVDWADGLRAKFEVEGRNIDTGQLSPQAPGDINFQGLFSWQNQAFDVRLNAQGELREQALDIALQVSGDEQQFIIREGRIQAGAGTLLLSGEVSRLGEGGIDLILRDDVKNMFMARIEGQAADGLWQFQVKDSRLESEHWPTLVQRDASSIVFKSSPGGASLKLSAFCLKGPLESVCLQGDLQGENLSTVLTLERVPVQRFKKWVAVSEASNEVLQGVVNLRRTEQRWALNSSIGIDDNNDLQVDFTVAHAGQTLDGKLRAKLDSLDWLSLLSEQFSHTRGRFGADLKLAGTLQQPEITGPIQLLEAGMNLPGTGTSLENVQLTANLKNLRQANLLGEMTSGKGRLKLSGEAIWWPVNEQSLSLDISGTDFVVADLPEVYAVASPDLHVSITQQRAFIEGEITLPVLAITLEDFPEQAVAVSADTRIVGEEVSPASTAPGMPVYTDVEVLLGEKVSFSGMGLDADLAGALSIKDTPGKPLRAIGKIEVEEGHFTAYGQNLSLQQSYFVFNGPVSQPALDLKAQRKIKDVTVGFLVRGTLQAPETEVFSKPAMSDSDALAYLLTGRPLSAADGEDGSLMLTALTQLGIKGSAGLVENIRSSTGLSTFEIDTGDELNETALKIGTYLTPQLYVQYAKRLFTDSDSIKARYDINEKLYFETESGTHSSFDLKYKIER